MYIWPFHCVLGQACRPCWQPLPVAAEHSGIRGFSSPWAWMRPWTTPSTRWRSSMRMRPLTASWTLSEVRSTARALQQL